MPLDIGRGFSGVPPPTAIPRFGGMRTCSGFGQLAGPISTLAGSIRDFMAVCPPWCFSSASRPTWADIYFFFSLLQSRVAVAHKRHLHISLPAYMWPLQNITDDFYFFLISLTLEPQFEKLYYHKISQNKQKLAPVTSSAFWGLSWLFYAVFVAFFFVMYDSKVEYVSVFLLVWENTQCYDLWEALVGIFSPFFTRYLIPHIYFLPTADANTKIELCNILTVIYWLQTI